MFIPIPNHVQQAIARLVTQYAGSPNIQNLLTAIIGPLQDIESVLGDMNTLRYLPDAQGVQLDVIGIIVGIARPPGMSDADYLNEILGQIKINTSQGQPEQVIQTFQLFTGALFILLDELFFASVIIESEIYFGSQAQINTIFTFIEEVLPVGVRCDGIVSFDPDAAFSMDGDLLGAGFGDLFDGSAGGGFATLNQFIENFAMDGDDLTGLGFGDLFDPLVGGTLASL